MRVTSIFFCLAVVVGGTSALLADEKPPPASAAPPGKGILEPLRPAAHLRGRTREQALAGTLEAARAAAEAGAGYEAARLLARLAESAPGSEAGRAARAQLEEWGVQGLPLSDATASEVAQQVRRAIASQEEAAEALARARNLIELDRYAEAAAQVLKVFREATSAEVVRRLEAFRGHYALPALADAEGGGGLAAKLERGREVARLSDLADFLREVEPETGRVFASLLQEAYPESRARKRDLGDDGFPFGPRGFRPPGMRGFRGGRGPFPPGGFAGWRGIRERGPAGPRGIQDVVAGPGQAVPAPPVSPEGAAKASPAGRGEGAPVGLPEAREAAGKLAALDGALAGDLLRLAIRVHAGAEGLAGAKEELAGLEKRLLAEAEVARREPAAEDRAGEEVARLREKPRAADLLFAEEGVHSYELELSEEAMTRLRAEPKTYVKGTFRSGGETLGEVGIRVKGSIGTFQPLEGENKTSFTVKFNQFVKAQKFRGLSKIILNNATQSAAYLSDFIGYGIFRDAGLPAPRVTFAEVALNGKRCGLYVQVEAATRDFLARWFEDPSGDLYEGPGDITNWEEMDLDSDAEACDRTKLRELAEAARKAADEGSLEPLAGLIDLDRLARFLAVEGFLNHWDGYHGPNNYRLYRDPASGRFQLIPHGADLLFGAAQGDIFRGGNGVLSRALLGCERGRRLHQQAVEEVLRTVWRPAVLRERVRRAFERIRAHAAADPRRPHTLSSIEERIQRTLLYFEERRRFVTWWLRSKDDPELAERLARMGGGRSQRFPGDGVMFFGPGGGPGIRPFPGGPGPGADRVIFRPGGPR